jgi:pyridoxine/pyridoxamine 5'-phosphate oxidase
VVHPQPESHASASDAPTDRLDSSPENASDSPLELLGRWLDDLVRRGAVEPHYVTLATASAAGVPSSRTVQLLAVESDALLFTTNAGSRKGVELSETGRAAVSAYWPATARSVNVTGDVAWADDAESDARFAVEPRRVQASRAVSFHGLPLEDEAEQLARFAELVASDTPVARPDHWRWFRVVPDTVTFWEAAPEALNRRLHYEKEEGRWTRRRIQA